MIATKRSSGFALPTVLIASIVMTVVLFAAVTSTAAMRVSMAAQYYNSMAKNAADAGAQYAQSCIQQGGTGHALWSDQHPLTPGSDCSGMTTCAGGTADPRCYVTYDSTNNIRTTFKVGTVTNDSGGSFMSAASYGYVQLFNSTSGAVWRTYNQGSSLIVSTDNNQPTRLFLVGGGGGGGGGAGGSPADGGSGNGGTSDYGSGGGGGQLIDTSYVLNYGDYAVQVGAGGTAGSISIGITGGGTGGASTFSGPGLTVTANGGGGGGALTKTTGGSGANGGGGGALGLGLYASTAQARAYNGGAGSSTYKGAGGGGGCGQDGLSASVSNTGGKGGDGISSTITGTAIYYCGGGGGGGRITHGAPGNGGISGCGAMDGCGYNVGTYYGSGGGGGARTAGYAGSSGVVMISFSNNLMTPPVCTGTVTVLAGASNNTICKYTGNGTFSYHIRPFMTF